MYSNRHFPVKGLAYRFDSRAFSVPDKMEAFNNFLWRQRSAIGNSIQMVARAHFNQKELNGLENAQIKEKFLEKPEIDWESFSENEKRGTFVRRVVRMQFLTDDESSKIPENKRPQGLVKKEQ